MSQASSSDRPAKRRSDSDRPDPERSDRDATQGRGYTPDESSSAPDSDSNAIDRDYRKSTPRSPATHTLRPGSSDGLRRTNFSRGQRDSPAEDPNAAARSPRPNRAAPAPQPPREAPRRDAAPKRDAPPRREVPPQSQIPTQRGEYPGSNTRRHTKSIRQPTPESEAEVTPYLLQQPPPPSSSSASQPRPPRSNARESDSAPSSPPRPPKPLPSHSQRPAPPAPRAGRRDSAASQSAEVAGNAGPSGSSQHQPPPSSSPPKPTRPAAITNTAAERSLRETAPAEPSAKIRATTMHGLRTTRIARIKPTNTRTGKTPGTTGTDTSRSIRTTKPIPRSDIHGGGDSGSGGSAVSWSNRLTPASPVASPRITQSVRRPSQPKKRDEDKYGYAPPEGGPMIPQKPPRNRQTTKALLLARGPQPGDKLGPYLLVSEIGRGGMGRVFLARERRGEYVAVKTIKARKNRLINRLDREAELGRKLNHPNIIRLIDSEVDTVWPYIVFELLDGRSLSRLPWWGRPMPPLQVMLIAAEVCKALAHSASVGVVHRDVKPGNIFLSYDGTVKLLDMGLAWGHGVRPLTAQGDVIGTVGYMAPEQLRNERQVDFRADIYSLGATCFRLLTGRLPYDNKVVPDLLDEMIRYGQREVRHFNPKVSAAVNGILKKMMTLEVRDRYASYDELLRDIERFASFQSELTKFAEDRKFMLKRLHSADTDGLRDAHLAGSDDNYKV